MLREVTKDLWVVDRPLRFAGLSLGTRMTVVRLDGGELLLHSPVALDDELRSALLALGTPRYAVAPNRFHHKFIGDYRAAFPDVSLFAAPGLPDKRKDLTFDVVLDDAAPAAWAGQLDQEHVKGIPAMNEVVFRHGASRTLLVCDLAFNIGPTASWGTRLAYRMMGSYGRLTPTLIERMLTRDRAAARASVQRLLDWDFERVIVTHGEVCEAGGKDALRAGFGWLLKEK
ncbi:MAG: DUF4336 domain-containing protein [Kofleriaceae bacterium]